MKADLFDQNGKKLTKDIEVKDEVFANEVNDKLLAQAVYVYLSNQRESNAHSKDRSEVSGGGKKPWNQKGTGRARAGSNRSPIWKGGGVTFGPRNDKNYKKIITRKSRQAAYRSAFSKLVQDNMLQFVDKFVFDDTKLASQAAKIAANFEAKKVTVVVGEKDQKLMNAFSNVTNSNVKMISEVSVYDLLTGGKILISESSLEYIHEKWAGNKPAKTKTNKKA